jgi:DNA-binding NtrC family response regulator
VALEDTTVTVDAGGARALAIEVTTPELRFEVPLPDAGELTIGRSRGCQVRIDHEAISREHARLRLSAGVARIEDLGSHNGTFVRGVQLVPGQAADVGLGDLVELGSVWLRLIRALPVAPPRRVWPHGYFEARVEEECARAARSARPFSLLRISVAGATGLAEEILASTLRGQDVLAAGPDRALEALLPETSADQAAIVVTRLRERLGARRVAAQLTMVCYPRDGASAAELLAGIDAQRGGPVRPGEPAGRYAASSEAMRQVITMVEQVARSDVSVLITGETGVGKEVCAEWIHRASARASRTFLRLHCTALPETLIEGELFGHEKGAFTGATAAKPGLLEAAEGGTVFLDEIGELPLSIQAKLLRVLDRREVLRLGGLKERQIDVRFLAATNRNLGTEVREGRFREDLYYRLNGVAVHVPPLRDRAGEIEPLALRFAEEAAARMSRPTPVITPLAAAALARHPWPGNIRELRNAIERAVVVCGDGDIEPGHLPLGGLGAPDGGVTARLPTPRGLRSEVEALEKERIVAALEAAGGNQSEAARRLGMSRGALLARLRAWGLSRP